MNALPGRSQRRKLLQTSSAAAGRERTRARALKARAAKRETLEMYLSFGTELTLKTTCVNEIDTPSIVEKIY
jgi:hypothetical protein